MKNSNGPKTSKKVDKKVNFVHKSNKDSKDTNKIPKGQTVKTSKKKNTPDTISEIQTSYSDQITDRDENESDYGLEEPPWYGNDIRQQWHK